MSYCLNPKCPNPSDLSNNNREICRHCGSELLVKGRFRIVRPLGGGGFGKTFEVDDAGTLKVLKILYKNHPKAVELFQHEATVLIRLSHPGIPKVDPDGYFPYLPNNFKEPLHCLVMEKIQGLNLEEWLKQRNNKPLNQEELIDCLTKLTEILEKVHGQQFFHRDIKPLNIMRRPNGQLVLIDFGAAREVTSTYLAKVGQGQNVTGIVSPGYTPPEQINGKAVPQSDFYALGRTCVYLATGSSPTAFPENPRTGKLIWRDKAPQISSELADVIDYLMAPFPGNRPQNAQMLLQCLYDIDPNGNPNSSQSGFVKPRQGSNSSNSSLISGRNSNNTSKQTGSSKIGAKVAKQTPKQKQTRQLKNFLIKALAATTVLIGITQLFAYFRFGDFPANPLRTLASIPSSQFLEQTIRGQQLGPVTALSISPTLQANQTPSEQVFATATFRDIGLWDISGKLIYTFKGHTDLVRALSISQDGKTMASAGDDKTIRLWNVDKQFRMRTVNDAHSETVTALAISRNGKTLVSGSADKTVRVWQLPAINRIRTLQGHQGTVNALAISPNGQIIASASEDQTIKIWDMATGKELRTLKGHEGPVHSLAINPQGTVLASGSDDRTIRLWDIKTGKLQKTLEGHSTPVQSLVISSDGKFLASAGESVKFWDLKIGKLTNNLIAPHGSVSAIVLTADNQKLLAGSEDKTVKIWRIP